MLLLNEEKIRRIIFSLSDLDGENGGIDWVKFLGVQLDPGLVWDAHIDYTTARLGSALFVIRSLSGCVSRDALRMAYLSLLHSTLTYALITWGHAAQARRAFGLQRRAVRLVFDLHPYTGMIVGTHFELCENLHCHRLTFWRVCFM